MQEKNRWLRPALAAALAGGIGLWFSASARADSITVKSGNGQIVIKDAHITRIQDDSVYFTTAEKDTEDSRPVKMVIKFQVDDEPAFTAAEEAYANGDFKTAADDYNKAVGTTSQNWVKTRASVRLLDAAAKSGDFGDAVKGFLAMADRDPDLAKSHRPDIASAKQGDLDGAITLVKTDLNSGNVKVEEQKVLLPFLAELDMAKGDSASAGDVLQQEVKIDPDAAKNPLVLRAQASIALGAAGDDLKQSKWQDAENVISKQQQVFIDPTQQADALYDLAQAKEGMASKADKDSLKDAANAYMRVAAIFKDVEGKPHVADSLLKAGKLEEQVKPSEAVLVYQQAATLFKESDPEVAQQANAAIQRIQNPSH